MNDFLFNSWIFGVGISILSYQFGMFLKKKYPSPLCNPLLIAIIAVMLCLVVLRINYDSYYSGAKYLGYLLTPATVCLAIPLYQQLELLKQNLKAVLIGIAAGVLASLSSVYILALLFSFTHEQYVTLLSKSITTAIGIGVTEELGGFVTISVIAIIVTGILGNITAEKLCRVCRIEEPIAKGLAIGTSSHAIGTVKAMEMGPVEGAMSSLSIAVAGIFTVLIASVFAQFI